jgi:chemotaxis protein methyltransferase CheR
VDVAAAQQEFEFSARDFERVRTLIRAHAGIALNDSKRNMVYSRLSRRLRARGLRSFDAYLAELEAGGCAEHEEFVNALTTNLTAFWREPHHFPVLAQFLKRRAAAGRRMDLWCCAASTGEEPYTIAITALQAGVGAQVRVLATDIDTRVLDQARRGMYPAERVSGVDPEVRRRHFLRGRGANAGKVRVRPEVAGLVEFRPLNLLDARWPLRHPFSAIFCRNVMIYFDKDTQYAVLRRLAALLEPGGLLFAGHSENFSLAKDYLRACGRTVYERLPDAVL